MAQNLDHRISDLLPWAATELARLGLPDSPIQVQRLQDRPRTDAYAHRFLVGPGELPAFGVGEVWRGRFGEELRPDHERTPLAEGEVWLLAATSGADHRGGLLGLVDVVHALLEPETGCPWDLEQTHESLKKFLLEESYELFDAIDAGDAVAICEELGDVLLQPLMHARMAQKAGHFGLEEVAHRTAEKLVSRHPHVFGTADKLADPDEVLRQWEARKKVERGDQKRSMLDGLPKGLPALARAMGISQRVARVGFEWPDLESVWDKLREEIRELEEAKDPSEIESELGDVLFTVVQIARWHKLDAEEALRKMLARFSGRFAWIEANASVPLDQLSPQGWDDLWRQAKAAKA